jgi:hypothetical protein
MPLQSITFRGNARLQQCLVSDPSHVKKGDRGDHVTLIQGALLTLDNSEISGDEQAQQSYGQSTANAVLEYKKKRNIINFSYQSSADDIVGKMTIRSLDAEMLAQERGRFNLLLAVGVTVTPPRAAVVSQSHPLPSAWAKQMVAAHAPNVVAFPSPTGKKVTPELIVTGIKRAISAANGGLVIFAVGHGIESKDFSKGGGFDVADNKKMRIGGLGSNTDPNTFVDVFYADKPPKGSPVPFSQKEIDERNNPAGAKRRLKNFSIYQDLCKVFVDGKVAGVVLLTCKVGGSTDFLKKVASQWKTTIIAYRDFTNYVGGFPGRPSFHSSGRVRAVLNNDVGKAKSKNPGTNTPFAEVMFPLSRTDMVVVKP